VSRALLLVEPGRFAWGDVPEPVAEPGEVVVRARFTGLCGTDLHIVDGSHPRAAFPLAIGHEFVGVPESGRLAGQTVLIDPLLPCGACAACDIGASNACARLRLIGIDRDGALAGRIAVAEERLHVVPATIPDDVAPLAEPLAVAVHVVRRVPPVSGRFVVVVGGGPVGMLVAHVARRAGAAVVVSEPSSPRRSVAEALGFELLDAAAPVEDVARRTAGRLAPVVFDAAAAGPVASLVTQLVQPSGTIAIVGAYGGPTPFDLQAVMFKELSVVGHRTYLPQDIEAALGILDEDQGLLRPLMSGTVTADEVPATIEVLRAGQGLKYVVECPA
jgi:(R,R)-butanediol dehydrogenase/meso-butanediol dehydrogenase/diacetyl reductase